MLKGQLWLRVRHPIDVFVVLLASPVLLPLCVVAMVAVYVEDRSSPLVHLPRVGRGGSVINVTKIRSMRVAPPGADDSAITSAADQRITRTGSLLRAWRLDEIPQVWQVLRGNMALVGPRPEDARFVDMSSPTWRKALAARPAIAGLTQVLSSPWEEAHLDDDDPETTYATVAVPAKAAIDAWYVENASPSVDWTIIKSLADHFLRGVSFTDAHRLAADTIPEAAIFIGNDCEPVSP